MSAKKTPNNMPVWLGFLGANIGYSGIETMYFHVVSAMQKNKDEIWWDDFTDENISICYDNLMKHYQPGTVRNIIRYFLRFLDKYKNDIVSTRYKIILKNPEATPNNKFILLGHELEKVMNTPLQNPREDLARNIFVVMAISGARYQNVIDFSITNINSNTEKLFYTNEMTGIDVSAPAHPRLIEFIDKINSYGDTSTISQGNMVVLLKEAFRHIGIDSILPDGKKKCDKITFLQAHKTFATTLYMAGISISVIQNWMGLTHRNSVITHIVGYKKKSKKVRKLSEILGV